MQFKTDWTSDDYYNSGDLNRVESNTKYIADYLAALSYNIPLESVRTDRGMTSIDYVSSINRVERNIDIIKDSFLAPPGYQELKVWQVGAVFTYLDAIRLENNLKLLYEWTLNLKESLKFCGAFFCGDEGEIY